MPYAIHTLIFGVSRVVFCRPVSLRFLLFSEHIRAFPPAPVVLPWGRTDGAPVAANLIVARLRGGAVSADYFNRAIWKPAVLAAGLPADRLHGFHSLRHCYASVFLANSGSIRDLAAFLGHSDPGFTLRIYTHLMPESAERIRLRIGDALGAALSQSEKGTIEERNEKEAP